MQPGKAERPTLESQPCVTLDSPLPSLFPRILLCKVATTEAANPRDCSEDSFRSCRERAQSLAQRKLGAWWLLCPR